MKKVQLSIRFLSSTEDLGFFIFLEHVWESWRASRAEWYIKTKLKPKIHFIFLLLVRTRKNFDSFFFLIATIMPPLPLLYLPSLYTTLTYTTTPLPLCYRHYFIALPQLATASNLTATSPPIHCQTAAAAIPATTTMTMVMTHHFALVLATLIWQPS